jgi:hypothetical protein
MLALLRAPFSVEATRSLPHAWSVKAVMASAST